MCGFSRELGDNWRQKCDLATMLNIKKTYLNGFSHKKILFLFVAYLPSNGGKKILNLQNQLSHYDIKVYLANLKNHFVTSPSPISRVLVVICRSGSLEYLHTILEGKIVITNYM